jgi:hypothetical protein
MYRQRSSLAAKALRTNVQLVDGRQKFGFYLGQVWV